MSAEREFFAEHGWLVVRGAVDAATLAELERGFDRVFPAALIQHAQPNQVWQVLGAARKQPAIAAWLAHESLARRAAHILDATRVQLLQDTLLCKPARVGGEVEWHQDYAYTGYLDPPRSLSVRLSLSGCDQSCGGLSVIDGSHRWGWQANARILDGDRVRDALDQLRPELRARVPGSMRALELMPGDLSLHHCLTLHKSGFNKSEHTRKTIIAHVFDGNCRLRRERLPPGAESHFATDPEGRLTGDAFPVLYSHE